MIKELNKHEFRNIVDFETEEKLKAASQKWIIETPKKITLPFYRKLKLESPEAVEHENNFNLTFEGYELGTPSEAYGVKIGTHLLFKSDLIQIYNNFILDLNKKLDALKKSLYAYSQTRKATEEKINPEQLDIFKKAKQNPYNYPKTILLNITYESYQTLKNKDIELIVNISYYEGLCIQLSKDNLLFLSELYFLIEKFDDINKYLLEKFPAGQYFKL